MLSEDFKTCTTITNKKHKFSVKLPREKYSFRLYNDDIIGTGTTKIDNSNQVLIKTEFRYLNGYQYFKQGFDNIFKDESTIIGLKNNGEFKKVTTVINYVVYLIVENGIYEINNDTLTTRTKISTSVTGKHLPSINSYKYSGKQLLKTDKYNTCLTLTNFNELEQEALSIKSEYMEMLDELDFN